MNAHSRPQTQLDRTSTRGSLRKGFAPEHSFRRRRPHAGAAAAHPFLQPTQHEPPITNEQRETTTEDTPVYGGPDARSLGARAGS